MDVKIQDYWVFIFLEGVIKLNISGVSRQTSKTQIKSDYKLILCTKYTAAVLEKNLNINHIFFINSSLSFNLLAQSVFCLPHSLVVSEKFVRAASNS